MNRQLRNAVLAAGFAVALVAAIDPRTPLSPVGIAAPIRLALALETLSLEPAALGIERALYEPASRPALQWWGESAFVGTSASEPAPATAPDWAAILTRADAGDPHAACELAVLLEDCRMATAVGDMVDTQIAIAAFNDASTAGTNAAVDAEDIAVLEASVDPLRAACAAVPAELLSRGWTYLLRAAIAGHEPSMFRFVIDLPVDPRAPADSTDAWSVYRDNAGLFVGHLMQRASPDALALAFRAAQGVAIAGDRPIQTRDPAAVVRLGTALIALREADAASEDSVERALAELSATESAQARAEGRRLAERWIHQDAEARLVAPSLVPTDECSGGWPGMRSEYTAYSF